MGRRNGAGTRTPSGADPAWVSVRGHGPAAEAEVAMRLWATWDLTASTIARLGELATRFANRLAVTGIGSLTSATAADCEQFVWATTRRRTPPSLHTVHLRRTALRTLYRAVIELEPGCTDPTSRLGLPAKPTGRTRPLTDREITLLRTVALTRARQAARTAATLALAEASASTGEIARIEWHHLDLDNATIRLPGATPISPRTGPLTPWGVGALRGWQTSHATTPTSPVFTTRSTDRHVAQAVVVNLLSGLLASAGLHDPDCKPASIRLWAGRHQLTSHGIEAAARALGLDSLDTTATLLGHHWNHQP